MKRIAVCLMLFVAGGAYGQTKLDFTVGEVNTLLHYVDTLTVTNVQTGIGHAIAVVSADGDTMLRLTLATGLTLSGDTLYAGLSSATVLMQAGTGTDSSLITTSIKIPMGYSTGIILDTLVYVMAGGSSPSVVPDVRYGTDISASGTAIITSPSAVTSNTTATKVSAFNNGTIAPGYMVWLTFSTVTTKPRTFFAYIIGHRQ